MDTNNVQTNTFAKGMNYDIADAMLPNDQYRYAENLRFVSNSGSNDGELELIPGSSVVGQINDCKVTKVLATNSADDYGIAIVQGEFDTSEFDQENLEEETQEESQETLQPSNYLDELEAYPNFYFVISGMSLKSGAVQITDPQENSYNVPYTFTVTFSQEKINGILRSILNYMHLYLKYVTENNQIRTVELNKNKYSASRTFSTTNGRITRWSFEIRNRGTDARYLIEKSAIENLRKESSYVKVVSAIYPESAHWNNAFDAQDVTVTNGVSVNFEKHYALPRNYYPYADVSEQPYVSTTFYQPSNPASEAPFYPFVNDNGNAYNVSRENNEDCIQVIPYLPEIPKVAEYTDYTIALYFTKKKITDFKDSVTGAYKFGMGNLYPQQVISARETIAGRPFSIDEKYDGVYWASLADEVESHIPVTLPDPLPDDKESAYLQDLYLYELNATILKGNKDLSEIDFTSEGFPITDETYLNRDVIVGFNSVKRFGPYSKGPYRFVLSAQRAKLLSQQGDIKEINDQIDESFADFYGKFDGVSCAPFTNIKERWWNGSHMENGQFVRGNYEYSYPQTITFVWTDITDNDDIANSFYPVIQTDTIQFNRDEDARIDTDPNVNYHLVYTGIVDISDDEPQQNEVRSIRSINRAEETAPQTASGWAIYAFKNNPAGLDIKRVFGPCATPIGNHFTSVLSTVLNVETPELVKLYIADSEHYLMSLNIQPFFTGEKSDPDKSVYKLIGTGNTYGGVLNPIDLEHISNVQSSRPSSICQYFYELYQDTGGSSGISPFTKIVATSNRLVSEDGGIKRYYYTGSNSSDTAGADRCNSYYKLKINTDPIFDKIRIYRIQYSSNLEEPNIHIIYEDNFTGSVEFIDDGSTAEKKIITNDELINEISKYQREIPSYIEQKDGYMFYAGIKNSMVSSNEEYEKWDARAYSPGSTVNGVRIFNAEEVNGNEVELYSFLSVLPSINTTTTSILSELFDGWTELTITTIDYATTVSSYTGIVYVEFDKTFYAYIKDIEYDETNSLVKYSYVYYSNFDNFNKNVSADVCYYCIDDLKKYQWGKDEYDNDILVEYVNSGLDSLVITQNSSLSKIYEKLKTIPLNANISNINRSFTHPYEINAWGFDERTIILDELSNKIGGVGINVDYYISYNVQFDGYFFGEKLLPGIPKSNSLLNSTTFVSTLPIHSDGQLWQEAVDQRYTLSLRRDEIYRYGIILYDKSGFCTPVKWIADIRTPDWNTTPPFVQINETVWDLLNLDNYFIGCRPMGIEFHVRNLPKNCVGFEIVRAKREYSDCATKTLGIISSTIEDPDGTFGSSGIVNVPKTLFIASRVKYDESWRETWYDSGCLATLNNTYTALLNNCISNNPQDLSLMTGSTATSNFYLDGDMCSLYGGLTYVDHLQFFSPEINYVNENMYDKLNLDNNTGLVLSMVGKVVDHDLSDNTQTISPKRRLENGQLVSEITYTVTGGAKSTWYNGEYTPSFLEFGQRFIRRLFGNPSKTYLVYDASIAKSTHKRESTGNFNYDDQGLISYHFHDYGRDNGGSPGTTKWGDNDFSAYKYWSVFYTGYQNAAHVVNGIGNKQLDPYTLYLDFTKSITAVQGNINPAISEIKIITGKNISRLSNGTTDTYAAYRDSKVGNYHLVSYPGAWGLAHFDYNREDGYVYNTKARLNISNDYDDPAMLNAFNAFVAGISGRCAVLGMDSSTNSYLKDCLMNDDPGTSYICNIRDLNTNPYGGTSRAAVDDTKYILTGHYCKVDSQQFEQIISVFDGDCFLLPFEFVVRHVLQSTAVSDGNSDFYKAERLLPRVTTVCQVPIESSIDMFHLPNDYQTFSKMRMDSLLRPLAPFIQDQPIHFSNLTGGDSNASQEGAMNGYDTKYSTSPEEAALSEIAFLYKQNEFLYRIMHSDLKTSGESLDTWLQPTPVSNKIDVDSKWGKITDMRTFKDRLMIWLEHGVSIASVNERAQVIDTGDMKLSLGSGGILSRIDYVIQGSGLKDGQRAVNNSIDSLYWWDHYAKEIYKYNGLSCIGLTKHAGVSNLVNQFDKDNTLSNDPQIYVDQRSNEVLFDISTKGALTYNEYTNSFFGVYTINPSGAVQFRDNVYMIYIDMPKDNTYDGTTVELWNNNESLAQSGNYKLYPKLKYIINKAPAYTKVYDNSEIEGTIYDGIDLTPLQFVFSTALKQVGYTDGTLIGYLDDLKKVTVHRERNFKFVIPRAIEYNREVDKNGVITNTKVNPEYGNRLRGKTMVCELTSTSNSLDFSLQYISTKYRISWS